MAMSMNMNSVTTVNPPDEYQLLEKLQVFKIQGRDKRDRKILRIVGKFFPARMLNSEVLKTYLEEKVFPKLESRPFTVVYFHSGVQRSDNFPGISTLSKIYEAIPASVKENIQAVHFVHPGLQSRLFLATFGRFIFSGGLYGKLNYVNRLEFMWEKVKRSEIEVPEFVKEHDDELEYRPMMDYGLESDHPRVYGVPAVEPSALSDLFYEMYCVRDEGYNRHSE